MLDADTVLAAFSGLPGRSLSLPVLQSRLSVGPGQRHVLRRLLKDLVRAGRLTRAGREFRLPLASTARQGVFRSKGRGRGVVEIADGGGTLAIRSAWAGDALDGDTVLVERVGEGTRVDLGRVLEVLERPQVIGTVQQRHGNSWLIPDNRRMPSSLPILPEDLGDATDGDAVVAEAISEPTAARARVVEVLGRAGSAAVEQGKILREFGLDPEFPQAVLDEAAALPHELRADEVARRWDLRPLPLVTIDPVDARDFDDAVAVEALPEGGYLLTVAIADVSHYVPEGGALDREAQRRANSTYLPDRVVPMLPERISNDLCSLRPEVERLAMGVQMRFSAEGQRLAARIDPAVIRSRARLTYEQVAEVLAGEAGPENPALPQRAQLLLLEELAHKLSAARLKQGALDLDLPEAKVLRDPATREVTDIVPRERNWAHRVVEEAMLAANRAVGDDFTARSVATLWRSHEAPEPLAMQAVLSLAQALGLAPAGGKLPKGADTGLLHGLIAKAGGGPLAQVMALRVLTTMKQARYTATDLGHYGLGCRAYLHFTSPIRRYPDLVAHRCVLGARYDAEQLVPLAESCSERERNSMRAEWAGMDLMAALLLQGREGEVFDGTVVAVTAGGLFVRLDRPWIQGFLPFAEMGDDFYEVSDLQHMAVGQTTRRTFRLADRLQVRLAASHPSRRQIELGLPLEPPAAG